MSLFHTLFPAQSRDFPGKRWSDIALRTVHLIGLLGVAGGLLFAAERSLWWPYLQLTVASGLAMMALSIWSNAIILIQLRGIAIAIKLLLLALIPLTDGADLGLLVAAVIISGLIAHAPGNVRYYSIYHGRRIEHL